MILAIDIGNTTTNFGVFEAGKLKSQFTIGTQSNRTPDEVTLQLKALAKGRRLHLTRAKQVIICSVVPRMTGVLTEALRSLGKVPVKIVGQDLKVPLNNKYHYPEQVGQDRLVGAYAAWVLYGKGKQDCIICDFGTAITIDLVKAPSKSTIDNRKSTIRPQAEYWGGIIAPGLEISLDALATKTALLPKVELKEPPELLGRDTANSIRSGVMFGCIALCEGLITQLKRKYTPKALVVATGGSSTFLMAHTKAIDHLRPHLVLEGLALLTTR